MKKKTLSPRSENVNFFLRTMTGHLKMQTRHDLANFLAALWFSLFFKPRRRQGYRSLQPHSNNAWMRPFCPGTLAGYIFFLHCLGQPVRRPTITPVGGANILPTHAPHILLSLFNSRVCLSVSGTGITWVCRLGIWFCVMFVFFSSGEARIWVIEPEPVRVDGLNVMAWLLFIHQSIFRFICEKL